MKVKVWRQEGPKTPGHWESFRAEVPGEMTVAGLLDYLNYDDDIVDEYGNRTTRISWECSCMQGICGACAMVINGTPALACETFLRDLKGDVLTLSPLQKFPVVKDLVVDRSIIQENLRRTNVYVQKYQRTKQSDAEHEHQYSVAKCLKCGLCLEVCPNYVNGETFYGAIFANDCYLVSARKPQQSGDIKEMYGAHFGAGCSKSLSCMDVCPMHLPTLASIAKMNRHKK